jgi:CHAD domain-containing protein
MPELVGTVPGLGGTTLTTGITGSRASDPVELIEVHHDTADLRLVRWGASLVCRAGAATPPGWTLVLPPVGDGDAESIRRPSGRTAVEDVPAELAFLVLPLTRHLPLQAVAVLHTQRVIHRLRSGTEDVAEVVDDVVSIMDKDVVAGRFRELTLRPLGADAGSLAAVHTVLEAHGAMPGAPVKALSALGPAALGAADVPDPVSVTPEDSAGAAVQAHLMTHVRRLILQDVRVRCDLPDSVHQMRVAARRLRSGLRVFAPLVEDAWARHLRDELGWVASELGLSRDSEVLLHRLDAHANKLSGPDAALIHEHLDPVMLAQVEAGRVEALNALRSQRHLDLLETLVQAAASPRLTPISGDSAREALPPLFDKAWRKLAREIQALDMNGPAEPWHEARITAKRARYAAEALVPVFGGPAKALATALGSVTEQLGEHQDASIAKDACRAMAGRFDGATGFALGLLHAYESEQELAARHAMVKAWPGVRRLAKRTTLG